jgi:hypothetical protein
MAAENRITYKQLTALRCGDQVVTAVSGDYRRSRRSSGTVVRIEDNQLVVSEPSPRSVPYGERHFRRDGLRLGGGRTVQLGDVIDATATSDERRRQMRVDAARGA